MRIWKLRFKQLINSILLWLIQLLQPEGEELNKKRTKIIIQITKKENLFPDDNSELRETLKEIFGITNHQSKLIWGEMEEVTKETFLANIQILAEIVPYKVIKKFFQTKNNK